MTGLTRESALAMLAGGLFAVLAYFAGDELMPVPGLPAAAAGLVPAGALVALLFVGYLLDARLVWLTLGCSGATVFGALLVLRGWTSDMGDLPGPLAPLMFAGHPGALEVVREGVAGVVVAIGSAIVFLRTMKGRRPAPKRKARRDGPYTAGWMVADEARKVFGGARGLIVGRFADDQLMRWQSDGHVATIAGTRQGKGVSAAAPNLIDYPGSVVVFDPKGENYMIAARARRAKGRPVYLLDPFGRAAAMSDGRVVDDRMDLLTLLDPESPEVVADATMFARLSATQRQATGNAGSEGHYFDQEGVDLIRALLLFLVYASPVELERAEVRERSVRALRELCTRDQESFLELMTWLQGLHHICGGVVAQSAEGFAKMHFRQWGGIAGTAKEFTNWLGDPAVATALSGDEIDVKRVLAGDADLFILAPISTLQVYGALPRVIIGMLLTHLQRRVGSPEILFLVDEVPQLGYVRPIEDAVFLAAGYGARLWLLIQDHDRFRAVYGRERAESILNMMSLIQVFTVSGTAAKGVAESLGEMTIMRRSEAASAGSQHRGLDVVGSRTDTTNVSHSEHNRTLMTAEEVNRLSRDESILLVRGFRPVRAQRVRYYDHLGFRGMFDRNPLHDGPQGTWEETGAGAAIVRALAARRVAHAAR